MDILSVAETWWPQAGVCHVSGGVMYYSRNNDRNHRKRVGIVLTEKLSRSVTNVLPFSDRIILLKLYAKPVNINVVPVYAPTSVGEGRFEAMVGPYGLGYAMIVANIFANSARRKT